MTELFHPPRPIQVRSAADGTPTHIQSAAGWQPITQVLNRWRLDCDWWRVPIAREYWRLLVDNTLAVECFCDRPTAAWFLERVYD